MVMRWATLLFAPGLLAGLAATTPVTAHHSTSMYNIDSPVTVTGVVKRFEWTNPRAFIYLEVDLGNGESIEWEVEMMSLNHLRAFGWMRDTVKPGEMISCTGGAAKSGAPSMISSVIVLADGRSIRS